MSAEVRRLQFFPPVLALMAAMSINLSIFALPRILGTLQASAELVEVVERRQPEWVGSSNPGPATVSPSQRVTIAMTRCFSSRLSHQNFKP